MNNIYTDMETRTAKYVAATQAAINERLARAGKTDNKDARKMTILTTPVRLCADSSCDTKRYSIYDCGEYVCKTYDLSDVLYRLGRYYANNKGAIRLVVNNAIGDIWGDAVGTPIYLTVAQDHDIFAPDPEGEGIRLCYTAYTSAGRQLYSTYSAAEMLNALVGDNISDDGMQRAWEQLDISVA